MDRLYLVVGVSTSNLLLKQIFCSFNMEFISSNAPPTKIETNYLCYNAMFSRFPRSSEMPSCNLYFLEHTSF